MTLRSVILKIEDITVLYGVIKALDGVSMEVIRGEVVSIIGANGAGKTTLLKTISGLIRPVSGVILFKGREITGLKTERIVRSGIVMAPEGRRIFPDLTVLENLELGGYTISKKALKRELFELVLTTFPRLKERLHQHAGTLSGGEQQMLAIGRALMGNPELLLLDEPSMGLSPIMTREIFGLIRHINEERKISIVIVEQNAYMALEHATRGYVLESGRIVMEGRAEELKTNPRVMEAYLGV